MAILNAQYTQKALNRQLSRDSSKSPFPSGIWTDSLDVLSIFHPYSSRNTAAILSQKPDATWIASFTDWTRCGRYIKKGEKGIRVIAPHICYAIDPDTGRMTQQLAFHLAHRFDISQTVAFDVPETPCCIRGAKVADYGLLRDALMAVSPVPMEFLNLRGDVNGYYDSDRRCIMLRDSLPDPQANKAIIRAIAHARLCEMDTTKAHADPCIQEIQSVAYVVCRYLGLDTPNYNADHINRWAKKQTLDDHKALMETVTRASGQIIKDLEELQATAAEPETRRK